MLPHLKRSRAKFSGLRAKVTRIQFSFTLPSRFDSIPSATHTNSVALLCWESHQILQLVQQPGLVSLPKWKCPSPFDIKAHVNKNKPCTVCSWFTKWIQTIFQQVIKRHYPWSGGKKKPCHKTKHVTQNKNPRLRKPLIFHGNQRQLQLTDELIKY